MKPNDSDAVRDLVAQYVKARNTKDGEAVRRLLTPEADQLVSSGEWRRGAANLVNGAMASSKRENGTSAITVDTVRFLGSDVALADGRYKTTSALGSVRNMWTTVVMQRTSEGWKIAAIRNMLPAPPPQR